MLVCVCVCTRSSWLGIVELLAAARGLSGPLLFSISLRFIRSLFVLYLTPSPLRPTFGLPSLFHDGDRPRERHNANGIPTQLYEKRVGGKSNQVKSAKLRF